MKNAGTLLLHQETLLIFIFVEKKSESFIPFFIHRSVINVSPLPLKMASRIAIMSFFVMQLSMVVLGRHLQHGVDFSPAVSTPPTPDVFSPPVVMESPSPPPSVIVSSPPPVVNMSSPPPPSVNMTSPPPSVNMTSPPMVDMSSPPPPPPHSPPSPRPSYGCFDLLDGTTCPACIMNSPNIIPDNLPPTLPTALVPPGPSTSSAGSPPSANGGNMNQMRIALALVIVGFVYSAF